MLYYRAQVYLQVFWRFICQYYAEMRSKIFQYRSDISLNEVVYYDFETTGLNPYHDQIIEFAFMEEDSGDYINELVNPQCKFEKIITDITGIYPDELQDMPPIEAHISRIIDFITPTKRPYDFNTYLVAHNNDGFDKIFLNETIKRINKTRINPINIDCKHIDTLLLAKKLLPKLRSYSLKNLSTHFKIKAGTHRALDDTKCLQQVYHHLLEIMSKEHKVFKHYLLENPEEVYNYLYN